MLTCQLQLQFVRNRLGQQFRHIFSLNLLSDIVPIIVLHTEASNIAEDVLCVEVGVDVDVDGNVAIIVDIDGKYLESNW